MGNEVSSPEKSGTCSIHTSLNLHCRRCCNVHDIPLAESRRPSVEASSRCPFHTVGAPHPRCINCNPPLLLNRATDGTSRPIEIGPCQVHTTRNAFCERCNGTPYTELLQESLPPVDALRKCSEHAHLNAAHPHCERCQQTVPIYSEPSPANLVEALEGFDAQSFAIVSCNVHQRRVPGCRSCYTAARREFIVNGASQAELTAMAAAESSHTQHANTPEVHGLIRNDPTPHRLNSNNTSGIGLALQLNPPPMRCNRHTDNAPNEYCQTCNDIAFTDLTTQSDPSASTLPRSSPERRRCNRHGPSTPNANCLTADV